MYKNYFGFSEYPFENNLDQRFLFFSAHYKEIAETLLNFIRLKKSIAVICGDIGTGKTMLVHYLLERLPDSIHPILIMNPHVSFIEILRYIAEILKIDVNGTEVLLDLVDQVKAALVEASRKGQRLILIIDEAHLLSGKSIEQIRLLSSIEIQERKLFQILLIGQCELSSKLNRPEMRQLRQQININSLLESIDAVETIQYINHRLEIVGSSFDDCFKSNCKHLIFKMTKGVPRSINYLCDNALLACMTEKRQKVNGHVLKKAGKALQSDIHFSPRTYAVSLARSWKTFRPLATFGAYGLIMILLGIYGNLGKVSAKTMSFLHGLFTSDSTPARPTVAVNPTIIYYHIPQTETNTKSPRIKPGSFGMLPPSVGKNIKSENEDLFLFNPKRVIVKDGDTLTGIASKFFPKNVAEGIKEILAINPMIDDKDRIYIGQELIIPETDPKK
jgi:type II secretory pathway predicted ATPase ExeA